MNSRIILAKGIKLDRDYNNVLNYTTEAMLSLLRSSSHLINEANNYSFIRSTRNKLFVGFPYTECLQANYIAFQNPDYSNKWFFAWIDEVIFKGSTNGCEITFTIDSWSTWFEKVTTKPCFIVREHANDDTIGINTIPENLDVGEVRENDSVIYEGLGNQFYVAIETSYLPKEKSVNNLNPVDKEGLSFSGVTQYNGNFFGNKVVIFPTTGNVPVPTIDPENPDEANDPATVNYFENINHFIYRINWDGHIADIRNMYIVPKLLIPSNRISWSKAYYQIPSQAKDTFVWGELSASVYPIIDTIQIQNYYSFDDYTPKNNKLYCYPTNYLYVTNNIGAFNIYKYEDFYFDNIEDVGIIVFNLMLALQIGVSGRLVPQNYKKIEDNLDESLPLAKYPTCSWSGDTFVNWLTQQGVNEITNFVGSVAGDYFGMKAMSAGDIEEGQVPFLSSASQGAKVIGHLRESVLQPQIQGGQNTADVTWGTENNTFKFIHMRAKKEYLEIIDDYFSRYGYQTNKTKVPNITGRTYWNYIEIGSTEEIGYGEIPSKHMQIINNACRKGVTIWHSHENMGNYNLNNTIIE